MVAAESSCPVCDFVIREIHGIYRALPENRGSHFSQFISDYEAVRSAEGRGSHTSDYYLALPFRDLSGRNAWQWQIRASTWRFIERRVLPEIERGYPTGMDVLDIGAGNGWMSYRLALRGHRAIALDLQDNDMDGLGAAKHYFAQLSQPFLRFQAEMDGLPFAANQFDLIIFNASFHYSTDYFQTLAESLRCLRPDGRLIVADSPFYSHSESGQQMICEKHERLKKEFGRRSDSIQSVEYLTSEMLEDLANKLGIEWETHRPWYGWNWAVRPLKARMQKRREPSKFYVFCAKVRKP
jgi:ubiquinone/menaquinone biosynthesis C-methylase UbiE